MLKADFRFRFVKILGNTQSISCVFALRNQKSALLKFCDLKLMEFRVDFGAEDEARLSPCKDGKPKYTEITLFQASSDYSLSAKGKHPLNNPLIFAKTKFERRAILCHLKEQTV